MSNNVKMCLEIFFGSACWVLNNFMCIVIYSIRNKGVLKKLTKHNYVVFSVCLQCCQIISGFSSTNAMSNLDKSIFDGLNIHKPKYPK